MPIYEYKCQKCDHLFEILQRNDKIAPICKYIPPSGSIEQICGGECKRLISKSSFSLKGGGWYKDGYTKPSKNDNNE